MHSKILKKSARVLALALIVMVGAGFGTASSFEAKAASKPKKAVLVSVSASSCREAVCKWKKVKGAKGYQVARNGAAVKNTSSLSFRDTDLKEETSYSYKVRAYKTYSKKQWYNKKTNKWQTKKPAKKHRGKSKKVTMYKYGAWSSSKSVKTKPHAYAEEKDSSREFSKGTTVRFVCGVCGDEGEEKVLPAGKDTPLEVKAERGISDRVFVGVTWNKALGAAGYKVERKTDSGSYAFLYYSRIPSYTDREVHEGKTYKYRITPYANEDGSGVAGNSFESEFVTPSGEENTVKVTLPKYSEEELDAADGAAGRSGAGRIYELALDSEESITMGYADINDTEYSFTGLKAGTYHVLVELAYITNAEEDERGLYGEPYTEKFGPYIIAPSARDIPNEEAEAPLPAMPKTLRAELTAENHVKLSWKGEGDSYKIYRNDTFLASAETCAYTDGKAQAGKKYTYKVTAVNGDAESGGAVVSVTTKALPAVTGLKASSDESSVTLTWDKAEGAEKYVIKELSPGHEAGEAKENTFTVTGLLPETEYSFSVAAVMYGKEGPSAVITVKTKKAETVFKENTSVYLEHRGVRIHLGQKWTDSLEESLDKACGENFRMCRADAVETGNSAYGNDENVYLFGTKDYKDFLAVYVAGNRIFRWQTNGEVMGVEDGAALKRGEVPKSSQSHAYSIFKYTNAAESVSAWEDKGYAPGGYIIGGFSFKISEPAFEFWDEATNREREKTGALHFVNALRYTTGKCEPLSYSKSLDGEGLSVTMTIDGITYKDQQVGASPKIYSCMQSDVFSHDPADITDGPYEKIPNYRVEEALMRELSLREEGVRIGYIGENMGKRGGRPTFAEDAVSAYNNSEGHIAAIVKPRHTYFGMGMAEGRGCGWHCEAYGYLSGR